jgi:hypothetical protein
MAGTLPAEISTTITQLNLRKKENQIVVVEGVETGEINRKPCSHHRFLAEGLGIVAARLSKLGRFPLFPKAGGKGWAAIARNKPSIFPRKSRPQTHFS